MIFFSNIEHPMRKKTGPNSNNKKKKKKIQNSNAYEVLFRAHLQTVFIFLFSHRDFPTEDDLQSDLISSREKKKKKREEIGMRTWVK